MDQKFPFKQFLKINLKVPEKSETNTISVDSVNKSTKTEIKEIGQEIIKHIKTLVSQTQYNTYFKNNFIMTNITEKNIEFSVSTIFIQTMLQGHYMSHIEESVKNILGKKYNILLNVNKFNINNKNDNNFTMDLMPTLDDLTMKAESKYLAHVNQESKSDVIDLHKTFDRFIVGPSNNMAFATANAVANNPGKTGKYPSLYIYSQSGLGKTHLLHAIANSITEKHPNLITCLITARDFIKEMVDAIKDNNQPEFQKKYTEKIDVLMMDDIHELKNKQVTQNELFHIFNKLYHHGKQLIFTSDKTPKEINGIEERIKTRFQWGLVIDIQKPDLETRIAILKKRAYELDLYLNDEILNFIGCTIKTNIRELEGALIKLTAYSDIKKIEIDIDMAKELLAIQTDNETTEITIETIARATSHYFKIPLVDLKSKSRSKELAYARHIAIYLTQKITGTTLQEIGKFYGGRDHTSIIHAVRKIKTQVKTDFELSKNLTAIEQNL